MARRPKQHGLPVAVIDNTLLTRLVNLEIAQFLPLLFKLQRFANGCASHLSFRGGLLPSGPTRTGGHSPPLNGHTLPQTAIGDGRLMHRRFLWSLLLTCAFALCARAQDRAVWQIGEFNGSSDEFGAQLPAGGAFDVTANGPKDWGPTQQAVIPAKPDPSAARRIGFELAAAPRGAYRLRLGLILNSARVPVVQVEVNGHAGWFYQRPDRDFAEGNLEASTFPQYSIGALAVEIPADYLRRG